MEIERTPDTKVALTERERDESLQNLLVKTSRTFALAIPQLPQPTLREVTVAYLLFRSRSAVDSTVAIWSSW